MFKEVAGAFLEHLREAVVAFYGEDPRQSPDDGRIVNLHHFDRLAGLLASGGVYHGGRSDRDDRYIAPTILVNVPPDSPIMQEEVFGPILPVLEVRGVEDVIGFVRNARGVLDHGTGLDPGVRYPPYAERRRLRGLMMRLLS